MLLKKYITALGALMVAAAGMQAQELDINDSGWAISFNTATRTLNYTQNGKALLKNVSVQATVKDGVQLVSSDYPDVRLESEAVSDVFGEGTKYTYTYSGLSGKDNLQQSFYIYSDKGYLLTSAAVTAVEGQTSSYYIAPIVTTTAATFLPSGGQNYIYDMPHDNDNWVGYAAQPWSMGVSVSSCEVSAYYDVISREGLIVGSIEHDNWKSGVTGTPNGTNRLRNLTVAAGVVGSRTNDIRLGAPSLSRHGAISGGTVSSPRYFFGYYNDWRNGLEDLGAATEKLCPKLPWDGGTIFAWQSWGGVAEKVNYEGAMDVADFFKNELMTANFHNENGTCYIVLDSFWDNLSDDQLRDFVKRCKENGQHPGIYHTPFSYWGNETEAARNYPYSGCSYTWADMSLKANGRLRKIASIALDPTHPATIEWNKKRMTKFKDLGFEYVKLDFINNGTLEADSYYAEGVTTGMQAYTYGMDKLLKQADGLFIDLSIAPVFPAKGHARRISCDAWGELDNSQYALNSLTLGWWLDRVYQYNDPDHLVLSRAENEGAARIRYTSGVMTGTVLLGDNYSLKGTCLGKQSERDLALKLATNDEVNAVGRLGRSFRPVEGSLSHNFNRWNKYFYGVDSEWVLDTPNALYYVVMNYDKSTQLDRTADFARLGIESDNVKTVKELWTGRTIDVLSSGLPVSVPATDVRLYRIEKITPSAVSSLEGETGDELLSLRFSDGSLQARTAEGIAALEVYGLDGRLLSKTAFDGRGREVNVPLTVSGVCLAKVMTRKGNVYTAKVMAL